MAGKKNFNISFKEITSPDGYSTTDKIYSVNMGNLVVGKLVVPNDDKFVLDISFEDNFNNYYLKNRILNETFKKFRRDILFVDKHGKEKLFSKTIKTPIIQKKETPEWKRYSGFDNKYMGKYREIKFNKQIGIELVFKKKAEIKDIVLVINTFLKKYPFVNFTVSQIVSKPVNINNTMSKTEIDAIVAHTMTWGEIKPQKKYTIPKPQTVEPKEDDFVPKSMEPARDIDPMILAKPLTLFCNPKQTIEEAKKSAQQKSNELYTFVKLLDSNGKFVCNIYPTITAKEHAMRRGGRIRDEIYSKLQEREIGA